MPELVVALIINDYKFFIFFAIHYTYFSDFIDIYLGYFVGLPLDVKFWS